MMKKYNKLFAKYNTSGRSMIEMLGVLAIVGVLSAGGVVGYSSAMDAYKANTTIDTINNALAEIIKGGYVEETPDANGTIAGMSDLCSGKALPANLCKKKENGDILAIGAFGETIEIAVVQDANVITVTPAVSGDDVCTTPPVVYAVFDFSNSKVSKSGCVKILTSTLFSENAGVASEMGGNTNHELPANIANITSICEDGNFEVKVFLDSIGLGACTP